MIDYFQQHIIPAAYTLLPPKMASRSATAMLLAIGLQESSFNFRRQVGGPALGVWQFESEGVRGVAAHARSCEHLATVLRILRYQTIPPNTPRQVQVTLEHNDVLACCMARLLLWTLPEPLAGRDDPDEGWRQYLEAWRPGKPHRGTWNAYYADAWRRVTG